MADGVYILGHDEAERGRLDAQGRALSEATAAMLARAGIGPGMRVLEVGPGTGAVTGLLAGLVGPSGSLVGVDRDGSGFASVRAAVTAAGGPAATDLRVGSVDGPCDALLAGGPFDAVVGRLVLMYLSDPRGAVARLVGTLRPGGVVAFQEVSMADGGSSPATPAVGRAYGLLREAFRRSGLQTRMGERLPGDVAAAGIAPSLHARTVMDHGGAGVMPGMLAGLVRSAGPAIVAAGLAARGEVDPGRLEAEMRAELDAAGAVVSSPAFVECWGRKAG